MHQVSQKKIRINEISPKKKPTYSKFREEKDQDKLSFKNKNQNTRSSRNKTGFTKRKKSMYFFHEEKNQHVKSFMKEK